MTESEGADRARTEVGFFRTPQGLRVVNSPTRSRILGLLGDGELAFEEIVVQTGRAKSTVSVHLRESVADGVLCSRSDPDDGRRKDFFIDAEYLGRSRTPTGSRPTSAASSPTTTRPTRTRSRSTAPCSGRSGSACSASVSTSTRSSMRPGGARPRARADLRRPDREGCSTDSRHSGTGTGSAGSRSPPRPRSTSSCTTASSAWTCRSWADRPAPSSGAAHGRLRGPLRRGGPGRGDRLLRDGQRPLPVCDRAGHRSLREEGEGPSASSVPVFEEVSVALLVPSLRGGVGLLPALLPAFLPGLGVRDHSPHIIVQGSLLAPCRPFCGWSFSRRPSFSPARKRPYGDIILLSSLDRGVGGQEPVRVLDQPVGGSVMKVSGAALRTERTGSSSSACTRRPSPGVSRGGGRARTFVTGWSTRSWRTGPRRVSSQVAMPIRASPGGSPAGSIPATSASAAFVAATSGTAGIPGRVRSRG